MSTLDVACERCEKRFRVRAEFAGRSTRCPGCSAPITIAGPSRSAPPPEPEDRTRHRPRPREADDHPPHPAADWNPVGAALGREQAAVLCLLASFVGSFVAWGIGSAALGFGQTQVVIGVMLLLVFGPVLAAGAFGIAARIAALRAPRESSSKGTAVASLLSASVAVGSLVVLGLTILSTMGTSPEPLIVPVTVVGSTAAGLGALATFVLFVAQIGIALRSAEVSQAFGRTAIAMCACVLGPLGLAFLLAVSSALSGPTYYGYGPSSGYHRPAEEMYLQTVVLVLAPLAVAVLLIRYHRLLAAGRRAVQLGPAGQYGG